MRILRIADVPGDPTGGMSRVMRFTGDVMTQRGHQVDYLWAANLGTSPLPKLRRFLVPMRLPGLVRRQMQQTGGYDVVEIHEPLAAFYCACGRRDARLPPAVVMSHGVESRGRQAMLAYRSARGLPISLKQRYAPLLRTWPADYALRRCAKVICLNTDDEQYLRALGVPSSRIARIPNGVSQMFLDAGRALALAPRPRSGLLFLAGWLERKGILDLVPAAESVLRRHPLLTLTVAGCGAPAEVVVRNFAPELRSQIRVVPRVRTDTELLDLYRTHAIFLLPSYFEGQPLAMLEAAALGLALLTTDLGGMRDFITDGEHGLLIPPGRPDELARCLDSLVRDPAAVRRLGEAARQRVQAFTWERTAAGMLAAYADAAASGPQAGQANRMAPGQAFHPATANWLPDSRDASVRGM